MAKKVKIYLLFLSVILLIPFAAQAQPKILEEDVIYLRNGSILRGTITEQIPGESVKIVTFDGTEFDLKTSEVDKIVRGAVSVHPNQGSLQWRCGADRVRCVTRLL